MTAFLRSTGSIKGLRAHMKAQQLQRTGMKAKALTRCANVKQISYLL